MPTLTNKHKRRKDALHSIRVPMSVFRRAQKAARLMKLTRNGFIVASMREKADAVLGAQSAA